MSTETEKTNSTSSREFPTILKLITWTRWISVITIVSSLVGALVMFIIGANNTLKAVSAFLVLNPEIIESTHLESADSANLLLLESLDNSLTGLTFLYFAYGIYSLFVANDDIKSKAPIWLNVNSIGDLKKTLLELVVVLLSIFLLKNLAERILSTGLDWDILVFPLSIVAIALSIKFMDLTE